MFKSVDFLTIFDNPVSAFICKLCLNMSKLLLFVNAPISATIKGICQETYVY